ncbi:Uma2 family endonuclease [Leptolyngbya cf. ectocarpi LEGE 11479]|uniref:Uma2 family endonuclease n=1 Tax=Leptolyngbya cf. ectocarpi LEGE 11479 TaxID=1828722 RepID=A0A928X0C1_LEPEC|nr:Uma2 family endonuclease [Leptolyngbya ectocarpi]MBE9065526.1 Uma2 family endonuclease [Leptolyngbya cf. ectocarpi LEGE 11479]
MATVKNRPMTLAEYLNYEADTDTRYELVDGLLVEMGAESTLNINIAIFLIVTFAQMIPVHLIHRGTEIEVKGELANTRYPDLMVLSEDCAASLAGKKRALITLDMSAPALVIEVVSSSDTDARSRNRDYVDKRQEYAQRGIPEYWIIDPIAAKVLILNLVNYAYEEQRFTGDDQLVSLLFPRLNLSCKSLLKAGQ